MSPAAGRCRYRPRPTPSYGGPACEGAVALIRPTSRRPMAASPVPTAATGCERAYRSDMARGLPIPPQGEGAHNPEHPGDASRPPTAGSEISFGRTTAELAAFRERPFSCREPSFMVPQDEPDKDITPSLARFSRCQQGCSRRRSVPSGVRAGGVRARDSWLRASAPRRIDPSWWRAAMRRRTMFAA